MYCASKYAVRCKFPKHWTGPGYATDTAVGLAESLHQEISPIGLRSICFEFGYFRTDFLAPGHRSGKKERIPDYKVIHEKYIDGLASTYLVFDS